MLYYFNGWQIFEINEPASKFRGKLIAIIDNKVLTMQSALSKALSKADSIDINVAFFYFNGFELLAKEKYGHNSSVSIGLIQGDTDKNDLIEKADRILYEAKAKGKNQFIYKMASEL